MSIRIPNFKGIETLRHYLKEANARKEQLSVPSEIPIETRMRNLKMINEKIAVYEDILETFNFLVLHQEIMLESLKIVVDESMKNKGKLSFATTRNLSKMKNTMNEQYNEYVKNNEA
jgi:hypothetical protein